MEIRLRSCTYVGSGWSVLQKVLKSIASKALSDAFLGADHESGLKNANFENFATARSF